ncbi:hypothetical protein [Nannocystis punicea]|uniref:Uncharacterized protein n=1 Tax=Nannocystis punicea TaxID=2995304 RepID=A0ABY7HGH1_9BACT|nr:hypothetical protein [Nannocystis poenicansa]WAS98208.1 hypothetical protein O0S08_18870 [Nannocystis poenicansa]
MADDDPITEGTFDRHLHRPLAAWVLARVRRAPSVELLTLAGLVVGLTGAVAVLLAAPRGVDWIFPAWLLFAFTVASRCRRLVAGEAEAGTLEFAIGAAFWVALTMRAAPGNPWACTLASVALVSALIHVGLHAELRRRFRDLTGGNGDAAPPSPRPSVAALARGLGPTVFHDIAAALLGPEHTGPRPAPRAARSLLAAPMRMAAPLGHDTHLALLYVTTAAAAIRLDLSFWTAALAVALGLNVWALLVVSAWRRSEALVRRLPPA